MAGRLHVALFFFLVYNTFSQKIPVKVGLMLPDQMPALKQQIGYPISAAACTIALDRIKKEQLLEQVDWSFVWYHPECEESLAAGIAIKLIMEDNIDMIIGPPCSIAAIVASQMGKYYHFPLVSWAATSAALDNRIRFPTFVRTVPSSEKLGEAIMELLQHFDWEIFAVMYTDDMARRICYFFNEGLQKQVDLRYRNAPTHLTLTHRINSASPTMEQIDKFLDELVDKARIVLVCLDRIADRRRFMIRANERGFNNDEYRFIMPQYLDDYGREEAWVDYGDVKDGKDAIAEVAFHDVWNVQLKQAEAEVVDTFKKEIPVRMKEWPWFLNTTKPDEQYGSTWSPYMHDAMYLYGRALNKTLEQGGGKADGELIAQNAMDVVFDGISGHVVLNKFGSREPSFVVMGKEPINNKWDELLYIHLGEKTDRVEYIVPEYLFWKEHGGQKPSDRPPCHFDGSLCKSDLNYDLIIGATVGGLAFIVIIILIIFFISYRMRMERLAMLLWKAPFSELIKFEDALNNSQLSLQSHHSQSSKMTTTTNASTAMMLKPKIGHYDIFYYRATPTMVIKHQGLIQIKTFDQNEFKHMVQLSHDNINPLIGVCIDGPQFFSVWKYCPKGSLQELFDKDNLQLDWFFKYSLIRDTAEGLGYLHSSLIKSHGLLTSECCLIDDRWQLKVSDYGLTSIRLMEKTKTKNLLWTAPELLRDERSPPLGTQMGDIYSLGIIVSEILTRAKAWSTAENQLSPDEIVYRVRKGEVPPCRPHIILPEESDVNPAVLHLMKDCLEESPDSRPDVRVIRSQLKGMLKGGATNLMDHVLSMMERYAASLEEQIEERTRQLIEEKKKADVLLYRMLPRTVADGLKTGITIEPENFEEATCFFSDIVGFTILSNKSSPLQVVNLLNELYSVFDGVIDGHDAYKVETIGDAYLVVSGVPTRNGDRHASEAADMAAGIIEAIKHVSIPHLPKERVQIRVGLNTGPLVAGVVGLSMPRYCIFGDTVATSELMESHSKPSRIHITEMTNMFLTEKIGGYRTECRGVQMIKGKGEMVTYFLLGKGSAIGDDD